MSTEKQDLKGKVTGRMAESVKQQYDVTIEAGACNYPLEIFDSKTKQKTLSVTSFLYPMDVEQGESPRKLYNKFSRFVFTVIDKSQGELSTPSCNVNVNDVPGIIEKSRCANLIDMQARYGKAQELNALHAINKKLDCVKQNIAFLFTLLKTGKAPEKKETGDTSAADVEKAKSVQIPTGSMKGKTPYQVLSENAGNLDQLKKHREWIQGNLEKYPKNQQQIDAIDAAIRLLEAGKLGEAAADASDAATGETVIPLLEAVPKPNAHQEPKDGLVDVKEISIDWVLGNKYPVLISIDNYKAPMERRDDGTVNAIKSKASEHKKSTMRLTCSDWFNLLHRIEAEMQNHERIYGPIREAMAEAANNANRAQATALPGNVL